MPRCFLSVKYYTGNVEFFLVLCTFGKMSTLKSLFSVIKHYRCVRKSPSNIPSLIHRLLCATISSGLKESPGCKDGLGVMSVYWNSQWPKFSSQQPCQTSHKIPCNSRSRSSFTLFSSSDTCIHTNKYITPNKNKNNKSSPSWRERGLALKHTEKFQ